MVGRDAEGTTQLPQARAVRNKVPGGVPRVLL